MSKTKALIRCGPSVQIESRIHIIRGCKVLLDTDLAALYQVPTYRLNEAVKRNRKRFPPDFMFRLTRKEHLHLTSQFAISSSHGGRRTDPYAFTEQGVAMLSSVLNSETAIRVNIAIMRAFLRLRELATAHQELAGKVADLERRCKGHDVDIDQIFLALQELLASSPAPRKRVGFPTPSA